ncbi:MAG: hypothetical protein H6R43_918 [Nitrospirae bacterium]|nr:hypothetical protein [Nitrospirota bacterium]
MNLLPEVLEEKSFKNSLFIESVRPEFLFLSFFNKADCRGFDMEEAQRTDQGEDVLQELLWSHDLNL